MTNETALISSKLETLKEELEAGNNGVLNDFWQKASQNGTPLIEPIPNDDNHSFVTFVWQDKGESESVKLVSNFSGKNATKEMSRLPGSDVWYTTYKVHNATNDSYQFAVKGENVVDPLNPRQHVFPDDKELDFSGWVSSVLEMPDAPPQPWSVPRNTVPSGQVTQHKINSEILNQGYRVWVYTPPGYTTNGTQFGFALFFDGWFYLNLIPTPVILDNLLADDLLPPMVAIMVGDLFSKTRTRDLSCYPPYEDFITTELLPWAQQNYHLSEDLTQNIIAGASRGGLMAAYMGLQHSELFGNVISQSGAFGWRPEDDHEDEWLTREYVRNPKMPLNFYLEAGLFETEVGLEGLGMYNLLKDNRHMRDVLQAKGYPVHYSEFHGGHNPMNWQGTLADALLALHGKNTR